ncbi:hypothetical protein NQ318_008023 [Aromia moschata]|uniref:Serpin domain-containing protein n=1 Tax=Aromia moschata TaxID=1265417 RepID=A0AAV8XJM1_9CUCU|nr:hypothetical protein NQ318_008023 [Aromia moschata]
MSGIDIEQRCCYHGFVHGVTFFKALRPHEGSVRLKMNHAKGRRPPVGLGDSLNVAISPYTVWSLMTILNEGVMDNTARQLENALGIPMDKTPVRSSFQNLSNTLLSDYMSQEAKADSVNLESNMAIFINEKYPVRKSFQAVSDHKAANDINGYVSQATKNRLTALVGSAHICSSPACYISKASGKMSFNTTETRRETFYDEQSNKIGEVSMMFQAAPFPYSQLEDIGAQAIELPYGLDRKLSMIVILPYKGETLTCVWSRMSQKPFSYILRALQEAEETFGDDDVHIGIKDVFDPDRASL